MKTIKSIVIALVAVALTSASAAFAATTPNNAGVTQVKALNVAHGEMVIVNGVACIAQVSGQHVVISPAQAAAPVAAAPAAAPHAQQVVVQQQPVQYVQQKPAGPTFGQRAGSVLRDGTKGAAGGAVQGAIVDPKNVGRWTAGGAAAGGAQNVVGQGISAVFGADRVSK